MATESLITVITPTILGREDQLEECKASVAAQSYPCNHKIMIDHAHRGPAWVRNQIIRQAVTPWLFFLDDDDVMDPDCVEHLFSFHEDYDVVYSWCRVPYALDLDEDFNPELIRGRNTIPVTALVRRGAFIKAGGFPEASKNEDLDLWINMIDTGARFYCTKERKWDYRRSETGRNLS